MRADKMYKLLSTPQHISKSWKRIISNISTQLEPNIKIHTGPAWSRPRVRGWGRGATQTGPWCVFIKIVFLPRLLFCYKTPQREQSLPPEEPIKTEIY